jgi:2-polyprenyl-3-methyl-5-hydroxy-6-metoxy-1,4-benzoquinol methylase/nucleoside 2-deoxyribosyltransferase
MSKEPNVFISWSGEAGKHFAEGLKKTFLSYPTIEPFISTEDIAPGTPSYQQLEDALRQAKIGIGCVTPVATETSQWFNFEAGFLRALKKPFVSLRFKNTPLAGQLKDLQAFNITSPSNSTSNTETFVTLLKTILEAIGVFADQEKIRRWVQGYQKEWKKVFQEVEQNILHNSVSSEASKLISEIRNLEKNNYLRSSDLLREVLILSLQESTKQIKETTEQHPAPASFYPHYLISLQDKLKPVVKAVAVVGQVENFWQEIIGEQILASTKKDSMRIFVFDTQDNFDRHYYQIIRHAQKYHVYAISSSNLLRIDTNIRDFSIVELGQNKIIATYHNSPTLCQKNIIFTCNHPEIAEWEQVFEKIKEAAIHITSDMIGNDNVTNRKNMTQEIFKDNNLSKYTEQPIEMSAYIDIPKYDEHEENHAYFQAMMARMIEIFSKHQRIHNKPVHALEFGAGTGIFTKRLAKQDSISKLSAIEIDWECFKYLQYKFPQSEYPHINIYKKDSRKYDPEGRFDYIFSSFADHHIKSIDKEQYFDNVKRNLNPNGLFIVGD